MTFPGPLTQLGRYQLQGVLGRGAMGMVYEALDPRLGRKVAVKTILKSHLADNALGHEYSVRFEREAQAAARLNHPHIVTVFDFGEEDEVAYIVMEFIEGRELAQHFEANQFFDRPTAIRILCELLDALAYAHERGIVHRDIKPANVMIDLQGRVKLTDFGVARLAESNADRTMPGTMVGTPSYMSPEQILGQAVGSRADLFAAGVILYQFLTHQRPFTGTGPWALQRKIISEEPLAPSTVNPDVPKVFDAIVQRALAKNPDHRFQSATAFADELKRALGPPSAEKPKVDPEATVLILPKPNALTGRTEGTSSVRPDSTHASVQPSVNPARRTAAETLPAAVRSALTMPSAAATGTLLRPATPPPNSAPPSPVPAQRQPMPTIAASSAPAVQTGPSWSWFAGLGVLGAAAAAALWWWPSQQPAGPRTPPAASAPAVATPPSHAAPAQAQASMPGTAATAASSAAAQASAAFTAVPHEPVAPPSAVAMPTGPASKPPVRTQTASRPAADAGSTVPRADRGTPSTARPATNARCAELLQRLQLGEDLSPDKLAIFQKECKR